MLGRSNQKAFKLAPTSWMLTSPWPLPGWLSSQAVALQTESHFSEHQHYLLYRIIGVSVSHFQVHLSRL